MAQLIVNTTKRDTHSTSGDEARGVVLLGKFRVEEELLSSVQYHLGEILPNLMEGVAYTAEDLVDAELWADFSSIYRRLSHLCLKHIATLPGSRLKDMASEKDGCFSFQLR